MLYSCFSTAFDSSTSYNLRHPQNALQSVMQTCCKVRLKTSSVPLFSFPLSLPPNLWRSWSPRSLCVFTGAAELYPGQILREDQRADTQLFNEVDLNGHPGSGRVHQSAAGSAEQQNHNHELFVKHLLTASYGGSEMRNHPHKAK